MTIVQETATERFNALSQRLSNVGALAEYQENEAHSSIMNTLKALAAYDIGTPQHELAVTMLSASLIVWKLAFYDHAKDVFDLLKGDQFTPEQNAQILGPANTRVALLHNIPAEHRNSLVNLIQSVLPSLKANPFW